MSTLKSSAENLTLNADGSNNDIILQSNASTKVTLDGQNGYVGIGTTSPTAPIHAETSASETGYAARFENNNTSNGDGLSVGIGSTAASEYICTMRANDVNIFDVKGNGRVGINKAAPDVPLDVVGDIRTSTGILFGSDTAAANALDDYEEGTWTPIINFGGASVGNAYSVQLGHYTKIGRAVTIYGHVCLSTKGSSTGHLNVAGLPFTPTGDYAPVSFRFADLSFADMLTGIIASSTTDMILYEVSNGGTGTTITDSNASATSRILFQTVYYTAS